MYSVQSVKMIDIFDNGSQNTGESQQYSADNVQNIDKFEHF